MSTLTTNAATATAPVARPVTDVPGIVDETARLLTRHYVLPDVAEQLAALLRRRLAEGAYDVVSAAELGALVTADLQSLNGDPNLRLHHHGGAESADRRRQFDASLGGVPRVELLDGNTALLELAPALFPLPWAAEPLSAALTLVARADALILDLRENTGGDPDTAAFVRDHLLADHSRPAPGPRFDTDRPVYVLTGPRTASDAEELARDLQRPGRAAVVGETTGGTAHPHETWTLHPDLTVAIPTPPTARTTTRVTPDIPCPAHQALSLAHTKALALLHA